MVEFRNVSKSFGKIQALSDISLKIDEGEFVFIVGPSGAGKTTLLRLLLAQTRPSSGQIVFDGKEIQKIKSGDIPYLRRKIGVVFQDFKLLPERTLRENVEVPLAVKGIPKTEWVPRVDQVLKLVGLDSRSEMFPSQLSGGELQRVSLARALVVNPKVIFADEPTGNLDWETADAIMDLLVRINKEGKTLIVTSHNQNIIDKVGARIVEIRDGRIVSDTKATHHKRHKNEKPSKN